MDNRGRAVSMPFQSPCSSRGFLACAYGGLHAQVFALKEDDDAWLEFIDGEVLAESDRKQHAWRTTKVNKNS